MLRLRNDAHSRRTSRRASTSSKTRLATSSATPTLSSKPRALRLTVAHPHLISLSSTGTCTRLSTTRPARSANCMGSSKTWRHLFFLSFLGSIPIPFLHAHSSTFISYATPFSCHIPPFTLPTKSCLGPSLRKCKPRLGRNQVEIQRASQVRATCERRQRGLLQVITVPDRNGI